MPGIEKIVNLSKPSEGKTGRIGRQRLDRGKVMLCPVGDSKNLIGILFPKSDMICSDLHFKRITLATTGKIQEEGQEWKLETKRIIAGILARVQVVEAVRQGRIQTTL